MRLVVLLGLFNGGLVLQIGLMGRVATALLVHLLSFEMKKGAIS